MRLRLLSSVSRSFRVRSRKLRRRPFDIFGFGDVCLGIGLLCERSQILRGMIRFVGSDLFLWHLSYPSSLDDSGPDGDCLRMLLCICRSSTRCPHHFGLCALNELYHPSFWRFRYLAQRGFFLSLLEKFLPSRFLLKRRISCTVDLSLGSMTPFACNNTIS